MERFVICGGRPLCGQVKTPAAKNAVLPVLAASVLTEEKVVLQGVSDLTDIRDMCEMLRRLGGTALREGETLHLCCAGVEDERLPEELTKKIRSSIFLLGPMLARRRRATVTCPGGCEIGLRPIDLHLKGLGMLGVHICERDGALQCDGSDMRAGNVYLDYPSVGATENVMMAAVLLPGRTTLHNAAREPEIQDLARFLRAMGARVDGEGTQCIVIEGVERLHGTVYRPIPDRIWAGTLLCAAAITGGDIGCQGARAEDMVPIAAKLSEMGCRVTETEDAVALRAEEPLRALSDLQTQPHPGFPTDMQSQLMALCAVARGTSVITENVFENRFGHAGDLNAMGAHIRISGRTAIVRGVGRLHGARVAARDLRGGAALVLAGLAAQGETLVENVGLIDRGYCRLEETLRALGAEIYREHV